MFAQCNINQATDQCAIMHAKEWLYCWVSKHNSTVEFTQGLVQNLQKTPIYETIRESEEVFFSLLFTQGDRKTAIVLGCNPRSSDGVAIFKKTLRWAKLNGLSLEIAPNIVLDDGETQRLLVELGLSQAHPGVAKTIPSVKESERAESRSHEGARMTETPRTPFLKKLFGRNKEGPAKSTEMERPVPLTDLARALLSNSNEASDAAIGQVLELSRSGSQAGLKALEESICWTRGNQTTDFYTPGLKALDGWSALDEAPKKLLALAREKALWTTPSKQIQELISLCQAGGTDMRALLSTANEIGCDQQQIRAIQLLGLHLVRA